MTTPTSIDRVIATNQIQELCYQYARGADRLDDNCWSSSFWDDGTFNHSESDKTIAEFSKELVGIMGQYFELTHHLNGNVLINFTDNDHAATETYFQAFHLTKAGSTREELAFIIGERRLNELVHNDGNVYDIIVGGRYLDHVERRDDIWKIKNRRLIFDYCTVQRSAVLRPGEGMTAMSEARMSRDNNDPSYFHHLT